MYVSKCWLDVANNDLWIHILQDPFAPYTQSTLSIVVRTMNFAILNPVVSAGPQTYTVPIKMFNWTLTYDIPDSNTTFVTRSSVENLFFTDS